MSACFAKNSSPAPTTGTSSPSSFPPPVFMPPPPSSSPSKCSSANPSSSAPDFLSFVGAQHAARHLGRGEEPHLNSNTRTKEFSLRDPDGYTSRLVRSLRAKKASQLPKLAGAPRGSAH